MLAVPEATPVTMPEPEPTIAIVPLLLIHVPPEVLPVSVVVRPAQTVLVPDMEDGVTFTEKATVREQPPDIVYIMVVVPRATPDTRPLADTGAMELLPLLHVPPVLAQLSADVPPRQALEVPFIGSIGFIVIVFVTAQVPRA